VHFATSNNKNFIAKSVSYFEIKQNIWEIGYVQFGVSMFKCKWVDDNTDVRMNYYGFTLVNLNKAYYYNEPFIIAY